MPSNGGALQWSPRHNPRATLFGLPFMSEELIQVLVVEDSPEEAAAVARAFPPSEFKVTVVGEGPEAVRRVTARLADVVVLDIGLPGMDGLQVLRMVRSVEEKRHLPVLFLSGNPDQELKIKAFELGADDFLDK